MSQHSSINSQDDHYSRLMAAMPSMIEIVNKFDSPKCQRMALQSLIGAFGLPIAAPALQDQSGDTALAVVPPLAPGASTTGSGAKASKKKATAKKVPKRLPVKVDVNFRPDGKESLRDFVAAKAPGTFYEKNTVIVFYFEDVLDFHEVTPDHIVLGYDECGWKAPADPSNSLVKTASDKRWIDTRDLNAISTTHIGRNRVKYDMSAAKERTA